MKAFDVCVKILLFYSVACCFVINPVSAQQKYFKITDDGRFYFFNDATIEQNKIVNGENTFVRPITPRTFFLEARNAKLFPESMTFADFERMSIAEKRSLLDSLQEFDWSKYQVSVEEEKPDMMNPDLAADTTYSIRNLAFNKESVTLYGDLASETGRMQKFMIYPIVRKENESITWTFEWIESDLYLKKRGYTNLDLPEEKIYEALLLKGIDLSTLNALLE